MRRDGRPELVIRGEHPWLVSNRLAMLVLPRRWDKIGEPVEELEWGKFDAAAGFRSRGLPPAVECFSAEVLRAYLAAGIGL